MIHKIVIHEINESQGWASMGDRMFVLDNQGSLGWCTKNNPATDGQRCETLAQLLELVLYKADELR